MLGIDVKMYVLISRRASPYSPCDTQFQCSYVMARTDWSIYVHHLRIGINN